MRTLLTIALALCLPAATWESILAEAQEAQARSDYRAAAAAYRRALAIRPDVPELWSNLGLMEHQSGEYSQAAEAFRRALKLNDSLFAPNLFLGLDLLQLKRHREALPPLLAAAKLQANDPQPALALGRAYHALWEPEESRTWYERATRLAPRNGEAWYGLGVAHFGMAEIAAAKLAASFRDSTYVAELTANAFGEQGRLTESINSYRALFAMAAAPPLCSHASYASVLRRQGVAAEAEQELRRDPESCRATRPDMDFSLPESSSAPELDQFAGDAFFSGHFGPVLKASGRLRQKYPNDPRGYYWAVRANQKLGVAALARAGEVEPDSPRVHALLGDFYQHRKLFNEAREEFSRMLAISPDNVAALAGLAAVWFADSKLEEANATARKALDRNPSDAEINLLMGEILVAQHQYAEAEPFLKRSLTAHPDLLPRVHALLGAVFARTGQAKQAIQELTQGLPSDEDGSVHYQLARLYQDAGDEKAASAALDQSKEIRARHDALAQEMLTPIH